MRDAKVVILAVPWGAVEKFATDTGKALAGKTLIDATNPLKRDMSGLVTDGQSGAEIVQSKIPDAKVVKAFNYAFASRQADPKVEGTQLDGFVAGDDATAKADALALVASIGFRPIDAGPLAMARSLEALALQIISLNARLGWSWANGWKIVGPTKA